MRRFYSDQQIRMWLATAKPAGPVTVRKILERDLDRTIQVGPRGGLRNGPVVAYAANRGVSAMGLAS